MFTEYDEAAVKATMKAATGHEWDVKQLSTRSERIGQAGCGCPMRMVADHCLSAEDIKLALADNKTAHLNSCVSAT